MIHCKNCKKLFFTFTRETIIERHTKFTISPIKVIQYLNKNEKEKCSVDDFFFEQELSVHKEKIRINEFDWAKFCPIDNDHVIVDIEENLFNIETIDDLIFVSSLVKENNDNVYIDLVEITNEQLEQLHNILNRNAVDDCLKINLKENVRWKE